MSNEEIRALDRDLEQSRSAFLRAREAQRHLNLDTRDVNRLGADKSQPDSIITHDVNHTHDVNRPEAQRRMNSDTHSATPDLREDVPHASERTRQDLPDSPTTVVDPELPRHGEHAQGTARAPRHTESAARSSAAAAAFIASL